MDFCSAGQEVLFKKVGGVELTVASRRGFLVKLERLAGFLRQPQ